MENVPKIHEKAHSIIVNIGKVNDIVYFGKVEDGWSITKHIKI